MRQSGKYCYGKTPIQTFLDILLFRKTLNQDSDSSLNYLNSSNAHLSDYVLSSTVNFALTQFVGCSRLII